LSSPTTPRAPRADAARNRAALVDAARSAFTATGEDPSLEGIARSAGVGIGTLYRNFPTREDLIAAVYANELDAVVDAADRSHPAPAADAFRAWLDRYAEFVAAKRGMAETLRVGALVGAAGAADTRGRVNAVVRGFLDAGAADGSLRDGLEADDVTTTLVGVFLATRGSSDPAQIGRLLDLVVEGVRAR
jgi:AcrR family transcriptional regulator